MTALLRSTTVAMVSRMSGFLCMLVILLIICQSYAQPSFLYHFCMNDKGNYTANGTYHNNLNTLLSNLSSNTDIDYGFYNFSLGQDGDKVNAIGLCRGDVKAEACRRCLNDSKVLLPQRCPNQKEAIGWYDNCMLRYSNRSLFNTMETAPSFFMWNLENATDFDQFNQALRNLLDSLVGHATPGDSKRKVAAANISGPAFQNIFALVQCTPDLSERDCTECLSGVIAELPQCCDGKKGGRIVRPSCNFRYETYSFYDPTNVEIPEATPPPPPPAPTPAPNVSALPPPPIDTLSTEGKRQLLLEMLKLII